MEWQKVMTRERRSKNKEWVKRKILIIVNRGLKSGWGVHFFFA
jgi:hypothetical protein